MTTWEYFFVSSTITPEGKTQADIQTAWSEHLALLDELGAVGWEAVCQLSITLDGMTSMLDPVTPKPRVLLFKRPLDQP